MATSEAALPPNSVESVGAALRGRPYRSSCKVHTTFVTFEAELLQFSRHFAGAVLRRGRSNPFDGSRRRLSRCRHGSIRGRESDRATREQFGIFWQRQTIAGAGQGLVGKCVRVGSRPHPRLPRASTSVLNQPDTRL